MLKKKKKQGEDELESANFSLGSQVSGIDESDVDVVSVLPESHTSATTDSNYRSKDHSLLNSRTGLQEDSYVDYESNVDKITTLPFEFQKTERASHRKQMAPFSKQAPSKWDDAQKWIASPTSSRVKSEPSTKKSNHGNRQPITKTVVEVCDQRLVPYEEPDTKQIDMNHSKDNKGHDVNWEGDYVSSKMDDSYSKSVLMIGDSVGDSEINLNRHDSSISIQNMTSVPPPSTVRPVS
ncbi:hypothetical protein R6Q59_002503 [Mikania micrantha]